MGNNGYYVIKATFRVQGKYIMSNSRDIKKFPSLCMILTTQMTKHLYFLRKIAKKLVTFKVGAIYIQHLILKPLPHSLNF